MSDQNEYLFLRGPIALDCWITIRADGPIDQGGIDRLIRILELCRPGFPPAKPDAARAPAPEIDHG